MDQSYRAQVAMAVEVLAPMIALLRIAPDPHPGTWVWGAPDVTAALLRARAGELLGEPAESRSALLVEAGRRVRSEPDILAGQDTADFNHSDDVLLPEGWSSDRLGKARPTPSTVEGAPPARSGSATGHEP